MCQKLRLVKRPFRSRPRPFNWKNLANDFFFKSTNASTRIVTGHVIYNPTYTYKFQLKTTQLPPKIYSDLWQRPSLNVLTSIMGTILWILIIGQALTFTGFAVTISIAIIIGFARKYYEKIMINSISFIILKLFDLPLQMHWTQKFLFIVSQQSPLS